MKCKIILLAAIFLSPTACHLYAAEMKEKSIEDMTAQEYGATLTINDVKLALFDRNDYQFDIRNAIRVACRFHPQDPWNHVYITLEKWSKEIKTASYFEGDQAKLAEMIAEDTTIKRFSDADEFKAIIDRLWHFNNPPFLKKSPKGYGINFKDGEWEKARTRHTYQYRTSPDSYDYRVRVDYYVDDPDEEILARRRQKHDE